MFHIFGMNVCCFPCLHLGVKVTMMAGFEPSAFVKALEEHKVRWRS